MATGETAEKKRWRLHDIAAIAAATPGMTRSPNFASTSAGFRRSITCAAAQPRLPNFAFEYDDGGAGDDARHRAQLRGARRDRDDAALRRHAEAAAGRMSSCSAAHIRAVRHRADGQPGSWLARRRQDARQAAKRARVPYTLGTLPAHQSKNSRRSLEDMMWFQLYRIAAARSCRRLRSRAPRAIRRRAGT